MKIRKFLGTLAATFVVVGAVQAGPTSLQDAIITASYNGDAGGMLGLDQLYQPGAGANVTAIAAGDIEFITADFRFMFDFTESGELTIYNNSEQPIPSGPYAMRFRFGPSLARPITGIALLDASAISGTPLLTVEDGDTIALDLSALQWHGPFAMFTAQLDSTTVPEPGGLALLLAGAGAAVLTRRRRRARH
jgi:hypothetical protein